MIIRFGCLKGALGAALCGCLAVAGCIDGGGGDGTTGVLAGRVTNAATGAGVEGVTVGVDPPMEGVEIVTEADGSYSESLPVGVYALSFGRDGYEPFASTVSVSGGQTATVDAALTPSQAVLVSANVSGDAVPGGVVTATATVEVLDGTTQVEGYSWTQSNSVDVAISGADTATATVTLPGATDYKNELIAVLAEPPISEDELPPNVPLPEGEFPGGLQERFYVVGLNPFSLEEAGLVTLEIEVDTSSGPYKQEVQIHTELPWKPAPGIRNVPIGVPVLLHGKSQAVYNWTLSGPGGSSATLADSQTQSPYFTPDVAGLYTVTVTDSTGDAPETVTMEIYGGTWEGAISGQDSDGRPLAASCTGCHNGTVAPDKFTPWAQTGHAEIFSSNLDTSTHYSESCFVCHTVGYDPAAENDGFDDAADYQEFLGAGLLNNPGDNWTTVLSDYPETAHLANIQCENCHGPQNGGAHFQGAPRIGLSAEVCAVCHGEPLRHGRYQQWQLSRHANYELAIEEGENGSCARCHTVNGFLQWLPILLDDDPATDPLADVTVDWTADEVHPATCAACHDPHSIGTTTGVTTNATVRISGDTPPLIGGFQALGVGRGAICMTCHNSRRGLRNDETFDQIVADGDASRAPHGSAQADVLMGHNAFLVDVGVRGPHSLIEDTCVNCHMEQTPPPDMLSYDLGGTNHTFFASDTICSRCHGEAFTAAGIKSAFEASSAELLELVEAAILRLIGDLIDDGNTLDLNGEAVVADAGDIADIAFGEAQGRQALTITLDDGSTYGPLGVNNIHVVDGSGADQGNLYDFADERLIKAGWNWNMANNDGSSGIHYPSFTFEYMDAAIAALNDLAAQ